MLWLEHLLGTRTEHLLGTRPLFWFRLGCSICRMLSTHECYMVCARMLWLAHFVGTRKLFFTWAWMLWLSHFVEHGKKRCVVYAVFRPSKHFECVLRAMQATSGEVGQVCIFVRLRCGGANNKTHSNSTKTVNPKD